MTASVLVAIERFHTQNSHCISQVADGLRECKRRRISPSVTCAVLSAMDASFQKSRLAVSASALVIY